MASMKLIPGGGVVTVDFKVNLTLDIWTAFAVWDTAGKQWASQGNAYQTPVTMPDFSFHPGLNTPGILVCVFNCFKPGPPPGDSLQIELLVRQDNSAVNCFTLSPVTMLPGSTSAVPVAQVSIKYELELL